MSRKINWEEPLSDFDRQYALDRGMVQEVADNEERFGKDASQDGRARRQRRIQDLRAELAELEAAEAAGQQGPSDAGVANPQVVGTPPANPVVDNTTVDGEQPPGAQQQQEPSDDYDDETKWTKSALQERIRQYNDQGYEIKVTGTRSELVDRLRWADEDSRVRTSDNT